MRTEKEIEALVELLFSEEYSSEFKSHTPKEIYKLFSETGLTLGFPVKNLFEVKHSTTNEKDLLKSILIQALFTMYMVYKKGEHTKDDFIQTVNNFYLSFLFHDDHAPINIAFGIQQFSHIMESRLTTGNNWFQDIMNRVFFSNFLYLDVMLYAQMLGGELSSHAVYKIRNKWVLRALWVIKKVSLVDKEIQEEEQDLLKSFLSSSLLPSQEYKKFLNKSLYESQMVLFSDIAEKEWLLRRFLLDLAVLTAWSDKKIKRLEREFLRQFCFLLDLEDEELDLSVQDIKTFAQQFDGALPFAKDRFDYQEISQEYINKLKAVLRKNQNRIRNEIRKNRELVYLLNKSRTQDLTEEEKKKVQAQLIDVLKTLPIFIFLALPFSFITLPVLLAILPSSVLPSSFQDEE